MSDLNRNPQAASRRTRREKKTIAAMVALYCRAHHAAAGMQTGGGTRSALVCTRCANLLSYALMRIERCVFRSAKPPCNRCEVHCYSRTMQAEVRSVMRFAGPRMIASHPVLTVLHLVDGMRVARRPAARSHPPPSR